MSMSLKLILGLYFILATTQGRRIKDARILIPPEDVPVVKCGDDIQMTCLAEGEPAPDVEWWFSNKDGSYNSEKSVLHHEGKAGKVKIKVDKFIVIRSTLIIRNVDESDEGMYQCRASNSNKRKKPGINLYQHWKVEEAPVDKVRCKEFTTTTTKLVPIESYNQTVLNDVIESTLTSSTVTSLKTSNSRKVEVDIKDHMTPAVQPSIVTSQTPTMPQQEQRVTSKLDQTINKLRKEKKKSKQGYKNSIQKRCPENSNQVIEIIDARIPRDKIQQSGDGDDGNSAQAAIFPRPWLMVLLNVLITIFAVMMSSS